jgi:hypothetical protein
VNNGGEKSKPVLRITSSSSIPAAASEHETVLKTVSLSAHTQPWRTFSANLLRLIVRSMFSIPNSEDPSMSYRHRRGAGPSLMIYFSKSLFLNLAAVRTMTWRRSGLSKLEIPHSDSMVMSIADTVCMLSEEHAKNRERRIEIE